MPWDGSTRPPGAHTRSWPRRAMRICSRIRASSGHTVEHRLSSLSACGCLRISCTVPVRACSDARLTLCHTAGRPLPHLGKDLLVEHPASTGGEFAGVKHGQYVLVFVQLLLPKT